MKRLFFTLVLATLATTLLNAQQNWFDKYKKLLNSNDTVALKKCIIQWEKANPESPDVIAAWYNYYIKRAMNNVLQLSTVQPADGKQYMELQNDTTKQTAGYLYEQTVYTKVFKSFPTGLIYLSEKCTFCCNKKSMTPL